MKKIILEKLLLVAVAFLFCVAAKAQKVNTPSDTLCNQSIKVFFDCTFCDIDFLRQEMNYINYTRDPKDAQVFILGTSQNTGSNGGEYSLVFLGQKEFKNMNDTLTFITKPNETEDEIRKEYLNVIKLGLVRYIARTSMAKNISIDFYNAPENELVQDKWRSWIFILDAGIYQSGEESYTSTSFWSSVTANRITPDWKLEFCYSNSFNENHYKISDIETVISINRSHSFDNLIVKSIGRHWSIGERFSTYTSDYSNIKYRAAVYPSIEYDLFPYAESTRKQLRFLYGIGYQQSFYNDTTIFNKTKEGLFKHSLEIAVEVKQPWGSISAAITGANYFNDFSLNNLNLWTTLSMRVVKGLSFTLEGNASLIHDQLYLPKEDATNEEILTQQRQLKTQYSYWFRVGLTYTFGSIYNNVVNPRFGN